MDIKGRINQNDMDNNKAKLELRTLAVTVALAAMLFFGKSIGVLQAQPAATGTGAPEGAVPDEQAQAACQQQMVNFGQYELGRFRDFIRTTFQNKSSTGSLLETAFGRYKELRTSLYNKYYQFYPQQGASLMTEGLGANACMSAVNDILNSARHELETRAVQTSTVKKTTALISKYQEINAQLATLNRTFITMKSYLDTFAAKLPCYIIKGCNKG